MHGANVNFPFQEPRFYPTQCDIPEDIRIQIVEWLNQTLATSIDLNSQIQQATWTLRGIHFYPFYLLFNEMLIQNGYFIHTISKRISALASTPLVSVRIAGQYSQLPEFPFDQDTTEETLQSLAHRVALHSRWVRQAIEQMIELGDRATADIYTQFSRTLDYHLWLLEAHYISK
ncbi:MAG: DNA starvation/stationary phase protection protein Dps [Cyanobacteria bacterium P01_F01_bin.150]